MRVTRFEVQFPFPVEFTREEQRALHDFFGAMCKRLQDQRPGEVVWLSGMGSAPIWKNGDIAGFDDEAYSFHITSREAYPGERE